MGGAVSAGRDNNELIDNLVGGSYIRTETVERVFRALDRADYMLPEERDQAYKDLAWRHGYLHLSAPCIYSEVMEGLDLKPGLSFLNIGSGTGYLSTLVGLILGSSGISHGVEENVSVVEYANKKLSQFMDISAALDEFDFCEPKFYCGNGLRLAPLETPYDRVYCGAGCPEEYQSYFKQLIKVGGVLVMPLNENLLQIRRVGPAQWSTHSLLSVSFAALRVPQENTELLKLDTLLPVRLQQLCRGVVRGAMLRGLRRRHPELRAPPAPPHAPAKRACRPKRICIPIENEADVDGLDALHDLDRADRGSGAHEMNALLSLVLSMGHNRVAGALRFDSRSPGEDGDVDDGGDDGGDDGDGDGGDDGGGGDGDDAGGAAADDAEHTDEEHPMEGRVNHALQQALDNHRVFNHLSEARRRAALRSSILMFDLTPRGRSGDATDSDSDSVTDSDGEADDANTGRSDATPQAAEGGGREPTAGTSRDSGAEAARPRRPRDARGDRSLPYVPSEVEICLGKMREEVVAPPTTTGTDSAPPAPTPATAEMEWEEGEPEEDSEEEARIDGGARWAAGSRSKRLKLDSGIGEITPSSHSSRSSPSSHSSLTNTESKTEETDESGESPAPAPAPAADTPPAPASDASGRRRRHKRHLGSWSSSTEGSEGSQGAASGSRHRRHKRRAGVSGSAGGSGRGRGSDAWRVRLSLRMKQAVKELPLPHALKKYVNLGRCYQF